MKKIIVSIFAGTILFSAFAQSGVKDDYVNDKNSKTPNQNKPPQKEQPQKDKKNSTSKTKYKLNTEYTTASGLKYKFTQLGKGPQATEGSNVSVHYVGTFPDGKKFDSSRDRNQPIKFKLGTGGVIKGWDEGIALMHVGDRAIFTVPPQLGYGEQAYGPIPANSTLIFDVELVDITEPVKPWTLKSNDTITTASGLQYIIVEKSK
ncbi:MAG: FKBP-type peptidyl-prolyl cis-trans isomerase, partial [Bacteroidia bacterium]